MTEISLSLKCYCSFNIQDRSVVMWNWKNSIPKMDTVKYKIRILLYLFIKFSKNCSNLKNLIKNIELLFTLLII